METVDKIKAVKEYAKWVSILLDNFRENNISFGDVVWVLVSRDTVFSQWDKLSDDEKNEVFQADNIVRSECKQVIAEDLPASGSTPQARAEGRWWWFLNEA